MPAFVELIPTRSSLNDTGNGWWTSLTQYPRYLSAVSFSASEALARDRTATCTSIAVTTQISSREHGSFSSWAAVRGRSTKCSALRLRGWSDQVQVFENSEKSGSRSSSCLTAARACGCSSWNAVSPLIWCPVSPQACTCGAVRRASSTTRPPGTRRLPTIVGPSASRHTGVESAQVSRTHGARYCMLFGFPRGLFLFPLIFLPAISLQCMCSHHPFIRLSRCCRLAFHNHLSVMSASRSIRDPINGLDGSACGGIRPHPHVSRQCRDMTHGSRLTFPGAGPVIATRV
jgi:hypothetical protein